MVIRLICSTLALTRSCSSRSERLAVGDREGREGRPRTRREGAFSRASRKYLRERNLSAAHASSSRHDESTFSSGKRKKADKTHLGNQARARGERGPTREGVDAKANARAREARERKAHFTARRRGRRNRRSAETEKANRRNKTRIPQARGSVGCEIRALELALRFDCRSGPRRLGSFASED